MTLNERQRERRGEYIAGLRQMADWYESHPELPAPLQSTYAFYGPGTSSGDPAGFVRALGGGRKSDVGENISIIKQFRGDVHIDLWLGKEQTCERVQVGTRKIAALPERVLPAEPEREEPVYEWKCPESLLGKLAEKSTTEVEESAIV